MTMTRRKPFFIAFTLMAGCCLSNDAYAQAPTNMPDSAVQAMLIKNTLVAVNHGNLTGNYTVLRDLSSENFRRKNTAADLSTTFANLRQQKLDLSPILVTKVQLTKQPRKDETRGRMLLVGFFPTRPRAVRFALIFQNVNGGWMIDEISVAVAPAKSDRKTPQAGSAGHSAQPVSSSRDTTMRRRPAPTRR